MESWLWSSYIWQGLYVALWHGGWNLKGMQVCAQERIRDEFIIACSQGNRSRPVRIARIFSWSCSDLLKDSLPKYCHNIYKMSACISDGRNCIQTMESSLSASLCSELLEVSFSVFGAILLAAAKWLEHYLIQWIKTRTVIKPARWFEGRDFYYKFFFFSFHFEVVSWCFSFFFLPKISGLEHTVPILSSFPSWLYHMC